MSTATAKAKGHRSKLSPSQAPRSPRRVSGPRTGVAHRVSVRPGAPVHARAVGLLRSLPDRAVIDRLVRGRAWIPVLGVMLVGIVAMQVELLKLNASIGRWIDRGTSLQSRNEQLRATVATLADDQRIERIAAKMGMVMPAPESVVFLTPQPGSDVQQAVARIRAPDASVFAALQPTVPSQSPLAAPGTTTSTTPTSTAPNTSTTPTSTAPTTTQTASTVRAASVPPPTPAPTGR